MNETCVKKVFVAGRSHCGKPAVIVDPNGRPLCQKHYDAWFKKIDKPKIGYFNKDSMTVQFGGEKSIPENRFTATAVKVPKYKYTIHERESLGNGWYGKSEQVEKTEDTAYLIFREGELIGWMRLWPSRGDALWKMDTAPHQVKQFAEKYQSSIKDTTLTNKIK